MAAPAAIIGLAISGGSLLHSITSSKRQQGMAEEQWEHTQKAQKAQYESDIATYQYNIERAESDIEALQAEKEEKIGTYWEEAQAFSRKQKAALGASGAVMGEGTPMEVMERTAQRQESEAAAIERSYRAEIEGLEEEKEFYGEQVEKTESLLDELFPEPKKEEKEEESPVGTKLEYQPYSGNIRYLSGSRRKRRRKMEFPFTGMSVRPRLNSRY